MYFLFVILSVLFIFILYTPLHLTYTQIYREKTKRDIILNDEDLRKSMQNRRYAPLHTLPTVRWHSNFDTLEGSSSCFSVPTLVTTTNTGTFDCSAVCNDKRAAYFL